jgi:hypothetical protein
VDRIWWHQECTAAPESAGIGDCSEAGQALAIGAIKIGTRRVYFSQNAEARARAGCCDMPLQTIGGHTYCHTPLHARRGASFGPFVAELRHSDRRGNSAQHPNQGRLSAVSLNGLVNSSRAPDDDPTLTDRISLYQSIRSNASMRAMPLSKEMAINLQSFGGDEAQ